jgi:hypothetical protein
MGAASRYAEQRKRFILLNNFKLILKYKNKLKVEKY